jgi:hypothetical protein
MAPTLHGLHAEARLKGERVTIEAYYDNDAPAQNAKVVVTTKQGAEVATGRTDEKGTFTFDRPKPGAYEVAVDDGEGHRAKIPIAIPSDPRYTDPPPGPDDGGVVVSAGPTRAEVTKLPWLRVVLGLGAIAAVSAALWLGVRKGNGVTGNDRP